MIPRPQKLSLLYIMIILRFGKNIITQKESLYKRRTRVGFVFKITYGRCAINDMMEKYAKEIFSELVPDNHHKIAIRAYKGRKSLSIGDKNDFGALHIHIPFAIYFNLLKNKDMALTYFRKEYIIAKLVSE